MKENYVLTIKAENRLGLLHLVTGMIEKKRIGIISLNAATTDIPEVVLITIELNVAECDLMTLALKLENIIEVFAVEAIKYDKVICLRPAYFKMDKAFLGTPKVSLLKEYSAVIVKWYPDAFLVAQYGSNTAICNLYNHLDGPYLLGFSQTGLISESALIAHDDIERIIRLAA